MPRVQIGRVANSRGLKKPKRRSWTPDDEWSLRERAGAREPISDISEALGRTTEAVRARALSLACAQATVAIDAVEEYLLVRRRTPPPRHLANRSFPRHFQHRVGTDTRPNTRIYGRRLLTISSVTFFPWPALADESIQVVSTSSIRKRSNVSRIKGVSLIDIMN